MVPTTLASLSVGLILAVAASTVRAETTELAERFRSMGTIIDIRAFGGDEAHLSEGIEHVRRLFERRHRRWYPWRPDAALARVNRQLRAGQPAKADNELIELLREARRVEQASGGRFNPAIGGLVRLWGFDQPPPYADRAPSDATIQDWLASQPSLSDLVLRNGRIESNNKAVQLDLGGIAKGATVHRAVELFRDAGAHAALVNAGGDLRVFGQPPGRNWRIGIRDPNDGVLATLEPTSGEAVFSSGDYERYQETGDGGRRGHVLDPRTGEPAQGAIHATVVTDDATRADAAATALLVAGADEWRSTARAMGLNSVMIIDADGTVRVSRRLAERLEWRDRQRERVVRELAPP